MMNCVSFDITRKVQFTRFDCCMVGTSIYSGSLCEKTYNMSKIRHLICPIKWKLQICWIIVTYKNNPSYLIIDNHKIKIVSLELFPLGVMRMCENVKT